MNKTKTVLLIQFNNKERIFNSKEENSLGRVALQSDRLRNAQTDIGAIIAEDCTDCAHARQLPPPALDKVWRRHTLCQKGVQAAERLIDGGVVGKQENARFQGIVRVKTGLNFVVF